MVRIIMANIPDMVGISFLLLLFCKSYYVPMTRTLFLTFAKQIVKSLDIFKLYVTMLLFFIPTGFYSFTSIQSYSI